MELAWLKLLLIVVIFRSWMVFDSDFEEQTYLEVIVNLFWFSLRQLRLNIFFLSHYVYRHLCKVFSLLSGIKYSFEYILKYYCGRFVFTPLRKFWWLWYKLRSKLEFQLFIIKCKILYWREIVFVSIRLRIAKITIYCLRIHSAIISRLYVITNHIISFVAFALKPFLKYHQITISSANRCIDNCIDILANGASKVREFYEICELQIRLAHALIKRAIRYYHYYAYKILLISGLNKLDIRGTLSSIIFSLRVFKHTLYKTFSFGYTISSFLYSITRFVKQWWAIFNVLYVLLVISFINNVNNSTFARFVHVAQVAEQSRGDIYPPVQQIGPRLLAAIRQTGEKAEEKLREIGWSGSFAKEIFNYTKRNNNFSDYSGANGNNSVLKVQDAIQYPNVIRYEIAGISEGIANVINKHSLGANCPCYILVLNNCYNNDSGIVQQIIRENIHDIVLDKDSTCKEIKMEVWSISMDEVTCRQHISTQCCYVIHDAVRKIINYTKSSNKHTVSTKFFITISVSIESSTNFAMLSYDSIYSIIDIIYNLIARNVNLREHAIELSFGIVISLARHTMSQDLLERIDINGNKESQIRGWAVDNYDIKMEKIISKLSNLMGHKQHIMRQKTSEIDFGNVQRHLCNRSTYFNRAQNRIDAPRCRNTNLSVHYQMLDLVRSYDKFSPLERFKSIHLIAALFEQCMITLSSDGVYTLSNIYARPVNKIPNIDFSLSAFYLAFFAENNDSINWAPLSDSLNNHDQVIGQLSQTEIYHQSHYESWQNLCKSISDSDVGTMIQVLQDYEKDSKKSWIDISQRVVEYSSKIAGDLNRIALKLQEQSHIQSTSEQNDIIQKLLEHTLLSALMILTVDLFKKFNNQIDLEVDMIAINPALTKLIILLMMQDLSTSVGSNSRISMLDVFCSYDFESHVRYLTDSHNTTQTIKKCINKLISDVLSLDCSQYNIAKKDGLLSDSNNDGLESFVRETKILGDDFAKRLSELPEYKPFDLNAVYGTDKIDINSLSFPEDQQLLNYSRTLVEIYNESLERYQFVERYNQRNSSSIARKYLSLFTFSVAIKEKIKDLEREVRSSNNSDLIEKIEFLQALFSINTEDKSAEILNKPDSLVTICSNFLGPLSRFHSNRIPVSNVVKFVQKTYGFFCHKYSLDPCSGLIDDVILNAKYGYLTKYSMCRYLNRLPTNNNESSRVSSAVLHFIKTNYQPNTAVIMGNVAKMRGNVRSVLRQIKDQKNKDSLKIEESLTSFKEQIIGFC